MKKESLFLWVLLTLVFMGWVFTGLSFAASKDDLYVKSVNTVTVGGSGVPYTDSINPANIRTVGITNSIVGAQTVSVTVTWGIAAGTSSPRTTTWPNNGVTFTASTTEGPDVEREDGGLVSCILSHCYTTGYVMPIAL
jgi:hypothetical protein